MSQNYFGRINHGVNFDAATRSEFGFSGFQDLSFFGAHDYDGIASLRAPDDGDITTDEATRLASINWNNIAVNQNAEITVSSLIAEGNSGNNEEDWDFNPNDTQVRFEYSFNNTNWLPIFYIVAEDNSAGPGFNSRPLFDSNGDGISDSPAVEIDETFRNFEGTFNTGSNTSVSIRIYIQHLTAGDEDVAFDNFTVTQAVANNPPVATCVAPFTVNLDASGNASITAADINNGSTDDMGIASTTIDVSSFNCSNIGPNTVTLTVTDSNGATDTCSTTVTVTDTTNPMVTAPADTAISCEDDSSPSATGTATAVDNCDANPTVVFSDVVSAIVGNNSTITRTWMATDTNSNVGNAVQVITVTDTAAPVVTAPTDTAISCEDDSSPSATGTATAVDNCDANPTVAFTDVVSAIVGNNSTITRTWTATDANSNVGNAVQVITITDVAAPVVTAPADIAISCENNNLTTTGSATALDNCDANPTVAFSDVVIGVIGNNSTIIRTWTGTDVNSNVGSAVQVIAVTDTAAPMITAPADTAISCEGDSSPSATGTATAVDNCDANPTIAFSDVVSTGVGNNSTITRTWTATDANNNVGNAVQVITVTDATDPTCLTQDISVELDATGNATIMASQIDNGSNDNCGIVTISVSPNTFTTNEVGNNTVTLTVTDENNNSSSCSAIVTVTANSLSSENQELNLFNISPNPFNNEISIKIPNRYAGNEFNITIYDLNGRKVFNEISTEDNGNINLSGLETLKHAIYLVKIVNINNGDSFNKRLIKY